MTQPNRAQRRAAEREASKPATAAKKPTRPQEVEGPRETNVGPILDRKNRMIDQLQVDLEVALADVAEWKAWALHLEELHGVPASDDATQDGEPRDNISDLPTAANAEAGN